MINERYDARWTVYIHIVPKYIRGDHDKYYVGITGADPKTRWGNKGINYRTHVWHSAIAKYGWDNIEHEIIATNLTKEEAKDMECALIKALQSDQHSFGYNRTKGGDSVPTDVIMEKSKPVYQFSLEGELIKVYSSTAEAARESGVTEGCISLIAKSQKQITGYTKYIWRYEKDVYLDKDKYYMKNTEKIIPANVYQFTKDGTFLRTFISVRHAADITSIPYDIIHGQLRSRSTRRLKSNKEYIWRYRKDVYFKDNKPVIKEPKDVSPILGIEVFQFDKEKKYIGHYKNAFAASKAVNGEISHSQILRQIKSKPKKISSAYYWRSMEDVELQNDGTYSMII